nr:hypothetical protein GCM10025699_15810 [Microbacterium flavescens]
MLEGRLHPEDEVVATLAQVEEAPVHALVETGVGCNGRLGKGRGGDVERADLDLDAAELHALVVLELARHGQEGARREVRDEVGESQGRGILLGAVLSRTRGRIHQLHRARLITKDDELHLLLIADGLDPSGDGDGAVGEAEELVDEDAFSHEAQVYVRVGSTPARAGGGDPGRDPGVCTQETPRVGRLASLRRPGRAAASDHRRRSPR